MSQELSEKIADKLEEQEEAEMLNSQPQEISASPAKEKRVTGQSRAGITKKISRPVAEKKARKLAQTRRQQNRRRNSHSRG